MFSLRTIAVVGTFLLSVLGTSPVYANATHFTPTPTIPTQNHKTIVHPYTTYGGGCTAYTDNGVFDETCISINSSGYVVPNTYTYGSGGNCVVNIYLYQNGNLITERDGASCLNPSYGISIHYVSNSNYQTYAYFQFPFGDYWHYSPYQYT